MKKEGAVNEQLLGGLNARIRNLASNDEGAARLLEAMLSRICDTIQASVDGWPSDATELRDVGELLLDALIDVKITCEDARLKTFIAKVEKLRAQGCL